MTNKAMIKKEDPALAAAEPTNVVSLPIATHPMDIDPAQFRAILDRRQANRRALLDWIREHLVENTDWGRIHNVGKSRCAWAAKGYARQCPDDSHWSKPCLFKSGAEKVIGMLGMTVNYPMLPEYEKAAYSGQAFSQIILRCELIGGNGHIAAVGVGARALARDDGDLNKALKMAEKSALIDATLRLAGLSEIFTQDLDDQKEESHGAHPPSATQNQTDPALPVPPAGAGDSPAAGAISPLQKRLLEAKINQLGLDRQRVKAWLEKATRGRIQHFQEMSPAIFDILLTKLDDWAQAPPAADPPDDAPAPPVPQGRPIEGTLIPEGYHCLTT